MQTKTENFIYFDYFLPIMDIRIKSTISLHHIKNNVSISRKTVEMLKPHLTNGLGASVSISCNNSISQFCLSLLSASNDKATNIKVFDVTSFFKTTLKIFIFEYIL